MILLIATRYQKSIASFLLVLFYCQITLPVLAIRHESPRLFLLKYSEPLGNWIRPAFSPGFLPNLKRDTRDNFEAKAVLSKTTKNFERNGVVENNSRHEKFIGGPGQPEMSSFKSVNADNMVDLFTGDFSYNIPLLDVGGYPVNIHYSSEVSMDQEASWVGLGWNINPGTISRSMRGLPDDFNGKDTIARTQSVKENRTIGVTLGADVEVFGGPVNLGATKGIFHNTYNGWGSETGINASINVGAASSGSLTSRLSISNNTQNGLNISPSFSAKLGDMEKTENGRSVGLGLSTNYNSRSGVSTLQFNVDVSQQRKISLQQRNASLSVGTSYPYAAISFATPSYTPSVTMPFTSKNFTFRAKVGNELWGIHGSATIEGYVSSQKIESRDKKQSLPAVGYLYYSASTNRNNVLLDFNREKELSFNAKTTPNIAIPQYTYDVYSISGEGTGGMFRPYRGDIGYIKDYTLRSKSDQGQFSLDVGFGNLFHGGVDIMKTESYTQNGEWNSANNLKNNINFRQNDTTYEAVYFRNPGEKTSNARAYQDMIGSDALMRVKLSGNQDNIRAESAFQIFNKGVNTSDLPVSGTLAKKQRDKRSQVITYLNALEASYLGLDKVIASYNENSIPNNCNDDTTTITRYDDKVRKSHHLSQINVLNADGRRYVYGLPVYNLEQKDVSFSVEKEADEQNVQRGLVKYTEGQDNSEDNNKGKEGYFSKDSIPAYAHSFLLTGILSPDYVDIKNDGITEDDLGDAVKFNYTRIYSDANPYEWRTPFEKDVANYNEGFKSYSRDDKGSYIYGKKEVWYLNSIESKTMVAVFHVSGDRKDLYSVNGENGDFNYTKPLRRLTRIDLYAKADLLKNNAEARPIKTVHFAHSYKLCKGVAGNPSIGKLTLDSVWFTYNKNEKGKLNPYIFNYHSENSNYNPAYHPKHYDRWGNYKPAQNPGNLSNADYPYAEQDSIKSALYAAAWTLSDIKLPSGGRMKVIYESDDYSYIQQKRAAQFFNIAGVSLTQAGTPGKSLYAKNGGKFKDCFYVHINSTIPLQSKIDIYQKYLEGMDYIYFRLSVKVPADKWGGGFEFIPVYAKVESYGLANSNSFWLKLSSVEGESPLVRNAIQFLRLNLPSKAYPFSEPGDNIKFEDAVKMLASGFKEVQNVINGFGKEARNRGLCKEIDIARSFIRLNNPIYKKYGGGLRVKRIEIYDNWNQMTNQREAVYGQEYNYTTSQKVNGKEILMSSGVASYEPMIGGEENPFRTPVEYTERLAPLAPVNNLFSEMPFGESYFPAAFVGYSKVRVRTINAKAKSANGWQETEFFTSKDFPTIVENTVLDGDSKRTYNPRLRNFLRINSIHQVTVSQGFKIELNDMNGKVKSQASYAENDSLHPISYVRNFYKVDNDSAYQKHLNNNVWLVDSLNGNVNTDGVIGKDIEVVMDMREQNSKTISGNTSANVDVFQAWLFPIITATFFKLPQREETRFRSAAVVKVIQRYGILDSIVAMDKGSIVTTKNLLYDGESGEVVLSRTNNEFNDPVYNFSYPAHWAYSGMGMAYKNINAVFTNLKLVEGKLYYGASRLNPYPVERFFESGDEVVVTGFKSNSAFQDCLSPLFDINPGIPIPQGLLPSRMWAIDASKGKEGHKGIYFIDEEGKPYSGWVLSMRILRSGKRNLLDATAGSIVSMVNPVREVSPGKYKIIVDSTSKVINASVVTYSDLWKVRNSQYQVDSCYTELQQETQYLPSSTTLLKLKRFISNNNTIEDVQVMVNPSKPALVASFDYVRTEHSFLGRDFRTKGIIHYDFSSLPADAVINSSKIILSLVPPDTLWNYETYRFNCGVFVTCERHNHDWRNESRAYAGNFASLLRRISTPWNASTKYLNFGVSTQNQVVMDNSASADPLSIPVTNLVKDVVEQKLPYYGFMFELRNPAQTTNLPHFLSINGSDFKIGGGPLLEVNYTTQKQTCVKVCRNNINDTSVNPYRWGILGNWRTHKAYTYYNDRKESDAAFTATDIRNEGELKSFASYWQFSNTALFEVSDTTKWVWNATSSLFNVKGYETENFDPLGRYNAALYGFNHSVPIAVAQNSKARELFYEGFEDLNYKTNSCATCVNNKDDDFTRNFDGVSISDQASHSGKYSLKLTREGISEVSWPVSSINDANAALSIKVDSIPVYIDTIIGKGTGLSATYQGYSTAGCPRVPTSQQNKITRTANQGPIDFYWGSGAPFSDMCSNFYNASWRGVLQAPYTDFYNFYAESDFSMSIRVNGVTVADGVTQVGTPVYLEAGKLYPVQIEYAHFISSVARAKMLWSRSADAGQMVVPVNYLYPENMTATDTTGSYVRNVQRYCIRMNKAKPENIITSKFTPLQGSRLLISAWAKVDEGSCPTETGIAASLKAIVYQGNSTETYDLEKTGVRIDGWQRYETVVTIPFNATKVLLRLSEPQGSLNTYIDDIRLHPFNANMKSYVYDDDNLRLMAELDENNYATFYEYDDDGTLVRVKKETEQGIKTIRETRSALLKEN